MTTITSTQPPVPTVQGAYSRPLPVARVQDLAAGDLIDVSTTHLPYWEPIAAIGAHDDDQDDEDSDYYVEDACDGSCHGVLFLADQQSWPLHVAAGELRVRFAAAADADQIETENSTQAHTAAAQTSHQ